MAEEHARRRRAAGALALPAFALAAASALALSAPAPADEGAPAPAGAPVPAGGRAVWVTRYDYRSADDVRRIVGHLADLGADRVLFQVRGRAASFYPSALEPWDPDLGGGDPGWDPLAVALEAAAARGLALEAWINALPLWKGTAPPRDPAHPYLRHPEWVVVGDDGAPQARSAHYVCANPALPAVRAHVAAVAAELASRPGVDAVHLDYVRWVTDLEGARDFSHDPATLAAFRAATGLAPGEDPAAWAVWKAAQVTEAVRAVRAAVRAARPACRLTAAVFPTRASRARVGQDVEAWVREGLVDALYPMTYAADRAELARRLDESLPLGRPEGLTGPPVPVFAGVAAFRHATADETTAQLALARARGAAGAAVFCYAALFDSADASELRERDAGLRAARAAAVAAAWSGTPRGSPPGRR